MTNSSKINTKAIIPGKESDFVKSFLERTKLFYNDKLEYLILQETKAEASVPDILIISWAKDKTISWVKERSKLNQLDLKILHFISTIRLKVVNTKLLHDKLGYDYKTIDRTICKLVKAQIIDFREDKIIKKNVNDNFFLKDIVAIEAKMHKCKKVIQQAEINQNFSSMSYVLIPDTKERKSNFIEPESNTGLITFNGDKAKIKKNAKRIKLPGSHFSWIINEYIGNMIYARTSK